MSKRFAHTMLMLVCCAACGRSAAQSRKDTTAAIEPPAHVTIIGCVQPSDATATNSAGVNDTKYMLTHAKANADTNASTSASARSGEPSRGSYRLNATDATLAPEVGHQVEIVAVVEEPEPVPTGTSGGSASTAAAPKLKVETIKMVATPCPE